MATPHWRKTGAVLGTSLSIALLCAAPVALAQGGGEGGGNGNSGGESCQPQQDKPKAARQNDGEQAGGDCERPKPQRPKLGKKEARKAAARKLGARLGDDGEIEGLRCRKAGRAAAVCKAHGWLASDEDADGRQGGEGDAGDEGDEWADETEWRATVRVRAYTNADGQRRLKVKLVKWVELGGDDDSDEDGGEQQPEGQQPPPPPPGGEGTA